MLKSYVKMHTNCCLHFCIITPALMLKKVSFVKKKKKKTPLKFIERFFCLHRTVGL